MVRPACSDTFLLSGAFLVSMGGSRTKLNVSDSLIECILKTADLTYLKYYMRHADKTLS